MTDSHPQIVIVGAGGFLGQSLYRYSFKKKNELLCISRSFQWSPEKDNKLKSDNFVNTNVEDVETYSHLIKKDSVLVYMAGSTNLTACQENPADDLSQHVSALTSLLKSIRYVNINKIIFISSGGAIYGEPLDDSSCENDECRPKSIYGLRNKILEDIISSLCLIYNKEFHIFRVANPYGVDQLSLRRRGLVMSLIASCFNNETIKIRSSGLQCRDYIYSQDFSEFLFEVASKTTLSIPPVLNICSGKSFNAHEVISIISRAINKSPNVEFIDDYLREDVFNSCINNELLSRTLDNINKPSLFSPLNKKINDMLEDLKVTNPSILPE